jgi:hypothetical protein
MKKVSFIASIVLLCISPLVAQSQEKKAEAYDFKGDRLGMTRKEFDKDHVHFFRIVNGERVPVDPESLRLHMPMTMQDMQAQNGVYAEPYPSCIDYKYQEHGEPVTTGSYLPFPGPATCQYDSSIGGIRTPVEVFFMDGILTAINLTFPRPRTETDLTLLKDGLTAKYGTPAKSFMSPAVPGQVPAGIILFWENANSIVEFQSVHCGFDSPIEINIWSFDMAEASRGVSCSDTKNDRLSPQLSRVFYVYKPLANLLSSRVREAVQKAVDKTKSDF